MRDVQKQRQPADSVVFHAAEKGKGREGRWQRDEEALVARMRELLVRRHGTLRLPEQLGL